MLAKVRSGPGTWDGVHVTEGTAVVELSVIRTDKGEALDVLRHRCGATAAVFVGDDVSDEEVFARLAGPDLGIKVGDGATLAAYRVRGPHEVAVVLSAAGRAAGGLAVRGGRAADRTAVHARRTGVRWRC